MVEAVQALPCLCGTGRRSVSLGPCRGAERFPEAHGPQVASCLKAIASVTSCLPPRGWLPSIRGVYGIDTGPSRRDLCRWDGTTDADRRGLCQYSATIGQEQVFGNRPSSSSDERLGAFARARSATFRPVRRWDGHLH